MNDRPTEVDFFDDVVPSYTLSGVIIINKTIFLKQSINGDPNFVVCLPDSFTWTYVVFMVCFLIISDDCRNSSRHLSQQSRIRVSLQHIITSHKMVEQSRKKSFPRLR